MLEYNPGLMTVRRNRSGRRGALVARIVLVVFACLLASGPLDHHDVACHMKSATHCTLCVSVPVPGSGSGPYAESRPLSTGEWIQMPACVSPLVSPASDPGGRSPPRA